MVSILQFRPPYDYMDYVMYSIGDAQQSIGLFLGVHISGVTILFLY